VEVARSGDLAYTRGAYQLSFKSPQGTQVTDQGKYLTVYRRQPDGSWKAVEDIFNSDLPAAH
jgi:ketosteroid isomerase-like protein